MYRLPQCSQELSLNQFKLAVLTHETSQYVAAVDTSYSPKAPFLDELGMRKKNQLFLQMAPLKKHYLLKNATSPKTGPNNGSNGQLYSDSS